MLFYFQALNFILNHPDKLSYPQLIQELIDITTILNLCKGSNEDNSENENKTDSCSDPLTLCSIQYCFRLAWKYEKALNKFLFKN